MKNKTITAKINSKNLGVIQVGERVFTRPSRYILLSSDRAIARKWGAKTIIFCGVEYQL